MAHNFKNQLSTSSDCSEKESQYITTVLSSLQDEDLIIFEKKPLVDDISISYSNYVKKRFEKHPERRRRLEYDLIKFYGGGQIDIKTILVVDNLYRIEFEELIYSYIVIFSYKDNEIVIKSSVPNFVALTTDVKTNLSNIEFYYPKILTTTVSIDYILKNGCSLARYGDGELNLCYGIDIGFQKHSLKLQNRLIEVLNHRCDDRILITLPEFNSKINNIVNCVGELTFWENYWLKMHNNLKHLFVQDWYGNTDISRNSVFFENNMQYIKKLWDRREVVFVIGEGGRFEIKSVLFDNLRSHKIIFGPPTDAFEKYDEIFNLCLKESKDALFLISMGPTATVLAFDLMKEGYQALDIGHLPNCYDQYLGVIRYPESIPHVQESHSPYPEQN